MIYEGLTLSNYLYVHFNKDYVVYLQVVDLKWNEFSFYLQIFIDAGLLLVVS